MTPENIKFVFFGTPELSVTILNILESKGLVPSLVVTREDSPQGRHLKLSPPPVKIWAEERGIKILQPKTLRDGEIGEALEVMAPPTTSDKSEVVGGWDVFIVVAYGKILPKEILSIPKHGALNVHPSLLPRLRGATPIQSAILLEEKTGTTIMLLDDEMDHGPIIAQKEILVENWPPYEPDLEQKLAIASGEMLAEILPDWVAGKISATPQDHSKATFTKKIETGDTEISFDDSPELNLRKIRAFARSPRAFAYFDTKNGHVRVIITKASTKNGILIIERVIPEGRKEMPFEDFRRGFL